MGNRKSGERENYLLFTRHVLYCSLMTFSSTSSSAMSREGRNSSPTGRGEGRSAARRIAACCRIPPRNAKRNMQCMWTGRLAGGETRGRERGTVRTRSSISRGWMTWKCQRDEGARCSAGTKICEESASSGHPYSVGHVWWLCKRMGGPRRKLCPRIAKVHTDNEACHIPRKRWLRHRLFPGELCTICWL